MATALDHLPASRDTEVFLRLWDRERLTPTLARHLLRLGFSAEEKARMRDLTRLNQGGRIGSEDLQELDAYLRAGMVLSILQSRARKLLGARPRRVNEHG